MDPLLSEIRFFELLSELFSLIRLLGLMDMFTVNRSSNYLDLRLEYRVCLEFANSALHSFFLPVWLNIFLRSWGFCKNPPLIVEHRPAVVVCSSEMTTWLLSPISFSARRVCSWGPGGKWKETINEAMI